MKKTFTKNQTEEIAHEVLAMLSPKESATVVALSGDLGAGKTTLSQALARLLGVHEQVISPTFVIMKMYDTEHENFSRLVHIDAYRLETSTELEKLGWAELMSDPKNLVLIEWPEKVTEAIPPHAHRVHLAHISDDEREIEFL